MFRYVSTILMGNMKKTKQRALASFTFYVLMNAIAINRLSALLPKPETFTIVNFITLITTLYYYVQK